MVVVIDYSALVLEEGGRGKDRYSHAVAILLQLLSEIAEIIDGS